jgi:hypothetical protein
VSLTPGAGRLSLADNANRGVFFRLALEDEPLRAWTGRGPIRLAANDLDPAAEIYTGVGDVQGLPELDRLFNGEARRVNLILSGVDPRAVAIIDSTFADMTHAGVQARFGHMRYDRLWNPLHAVRWVWDGLLDEVSIEMEPEEGAQTWTVTLSMSTAMVDANRPALAFWTPQYATAGDQGFQFVPGLNDGTSRIWPPR